MMIENVGVAVSLHADPAASCAGNIPLTLLDEVTDETIVAKNDHFNLEKSIKYHVSLVRLLLQLCNMQSSPTTCVLCSSVNSMILVQWFQI